MTEINNLSLYCTFEHISKSHPIKHMAKIEWSIKNFQLYKHSINAIH